MHSEEACFSSALKVLTEIGEMGLVQLIITEIQRKDLSNGNLLMVYKVIPTVCCGVKAMNNLLLKMEQS